MRASPTPEPGLLCWGMAAMALAVLLLLGSWSDAAEQWTVDRLEGDWYVVTGTTEPLLITIGWAGSPDARVTGYVVELLRTDGSLVGTLTVTGNVTEGRVPCPIGTVVVARVATRYSLDGPGTLTTTPFSELGPPVKCLLARPKWNPRGTLSDTEQVEFLDFSLFGAAFKGHFLGPTAPSP